MGTDGRCWVAADLSASCFPCSRIRLIFCLVSADSSSDSLDIPPVERDTFSSMDNLSGWVGDRGNCATEETAGAEATTDSIMLVVVVGGRGTDPGLGSLCTGLAAWLSASGRFQGSGNSLSSTGNRGRTFLISLGTVRNT